MGSIQYTPRWLHQEVTIPAASQIRIDPTFFSNQEIWNWQLHWLSISGSVVLDTTDRTYYLQNTLGGIARRLKWNIGYSQKGDINLAAISTDAILGCNHRQRQCSSWFDSALRLDLPIPFPLAPNAGIVAECRFDKKYDTSTEMTGWYYPGVVLNGYRKEIDGRKRPAQLAGHYHRLLGFGSDLPIESADMWNDGSSILYITEVLIQSYQLTDSLDSDDYTQFLPRLNETSWRINPNVGTPWMPRSEKIPSGCIAPFNRSMSDWNDESPRVYTFPPETVLKPDQRLGMEVENLSNKDQHVDICLFGLLEVQ